MIYLFHSSNTFGDNMIIRNCLELLSELAELEKLVSEKKDLLEELGLEVDCDDLLLKHISLKRAS